MPAKREMIFRHGQSKFAAVVTSRALLGERGAGHLVRFLHRHRATGWRGGLLHLLHVRAVALMPRRYERRKQGPLCRALRLNGKLCGDVAPYVYEGAPCCWVHLKTAAAGPRQRREAVARQGTRRLPAVRFAKRSL